MQQQANETTQKGSQKNVVIKHRYSMVPIPVGLSVFGMDEELTADEREPKIDQPSISSGKRMIFLFGQLVPEDDSVPWEKEPTPKTEDMKKRRQYPIGKAVWVIPRLTMPGYSKRYSFCPEGNLCRDCINFINGGYLLKKKQQSCRGRRKKRVARQDLDKPVLYFM